MAVEEGGGVGGGVSEVNERWGGGVVGLYPVFPEKPCLLDILFILLKRIAITPPFSPLSIHADNTHNLVRRGGCTILYWMSPPVVRHSPSIRISDRASTFLFRAHPHF